jgi:hypothetical protein
MQQFRASHFGRFPEDDATSTGRRGAMLPMVASLHSKREVSLCLSFLIRFIEF